MSATGDGGRGDAAGDDERADAAAEEADDSRPPAGRAALLAGPAGVAASALALVGAALLAPWFTWTGHALSHLGEVGRATAPLFNYGLILSGGLGLAFA